MARAVRSSNSRVDLIILGATILLALAARGLPQNMRDPVASSMRRTFLAPLVILQEREFYGAVIVGHLNDNGNRRGELRDGFGDAALVGCKAAVS